MVFQLEVLAILFNFMILKTIEYAQSFQVMYVILFVKKIEIIILVTELNSEGPFPRESTGRIQAAAYLLPFLAEKAVPAQVSEDLLPMV